MKIRRIPFGYIVTGGEVFLHPTESDAVKYIFETYCQGATYQEIADMLMKRKIPYSENRNYWNKMMIQRIILNRVYTGYSGYPAIIDTLLFDKVQSKRISKDSSRTFRHNNIRHTTMHYPILPYKPNLAIHRMTNEINLALEKPSDPDTVRTLIFKCAAERYNVIGVITNG